jgi:hypothetical protein
VSEITVLCDRDHRRKRQAVRKTCANLRLLSEGFSEIFHGEILSLNQNSMTVRARSTLDLGRRPVS